MERVLAVLLIVVLFLFGGVYLWNRPKQKINEPGSVENEKVTDEKRDSFNRIEEFAESYTTEFDPFHYQDPFPVIENTPIVDLKEADQELEPNDLVLGVEINGAARAYPIAMISQPVREVFNDELGGAAIAATW